MGFDGTAHVEKVTTEAVLLLDGRTGFPVPTTVQQPRTLPARTLEDEEVGTRTVDPDE